MKSLATGILLITLNSMTAIANDDFFSDIDVDTTEVTQGSNEGFSHNFFVQQKVKYGLSEPDKNYAFQREKPGLSQIQTDVFLEIKGKINSIFSYQLSSKAEVDWVEWQDGELHWQSNHERLIAKDIFIDAVFENGVWLRLGNQVFAWGESEGLAIGDVIAPNDLREFGQSELRDIREHVPALLLSVPVWGGKLNFVSTYKAGHNRYADETEEFYPYIAKRGFQPTFIEHDPEDDWEYAIKYDYQFNGGDLSVLIAETNTNDFFVERIMDSDPPILHLRQQRVEHLALSANKVYNSWLIKTELGHFRDQPVSINNFYEQRDQIRGMLGIEYSGWNDWLISYEINAIDQESSAIESSETIDQSNTVNSVGQVFRAQWDTFNNKLTQQLWHTKLIQDNGSISRYDLSYDWSDNLELGAAVVIYANSNQESQLYPIRHHDSLNFSIKCSF